MPRALQAAIDLISGDTWPRRRVVIYAALVLCALVIAACLGAAIAAKDMQSVRETSENAFWYGFSIVFAYVFGSILDDADKRRNQRKAQEPANTKPEGGE
jgi:predicted small secreted protein